VEHEQATTMLAAELYMLNELSPEEREQFEAHFFECAECAQQIRDISTMQASAAAVLKNEPHVSGRPEPIQQSAEGWLASLRLWWTRPALAWGAAGALLLVAGVMGWQLVALRSQMRPQILASVMLRPETRGEVSAISPQQLGPFLLLEADVPGATGQLAWELRKAGSSAIEMQGSGAAPQPGATFKLLAPAATLSPSEYQLTIRPAAGAPAGGPWVYRFQIQ
jgi:hypothetical protein